MYHSSNTNIIRILSKCICMFRKFLTTNTDYFHKHYLLTGLWNDREQSVCLWRRNWSFIQLCRTLVFNEYIHQQDQEKFKVEESFTLLHWLKNASFDIVYLKVHIKNIILSVVWHKYDTRNLITHPEGRSWNSWCQRTMRWCFWHYERRLNKRTKGTA